MEERKKWRSAKNEGAQKVKERKKWNSVKSEGAQKVEERKKWRSAKNTKKCENRMERKCNICCVNAVERK